MLKKCQRLSIYYIHIRIYIYIYTVCIVTIVYIYKLYHISYMYNAFLYHTVNSDSSFENFKLNHPYEPIDATGS